MSARKLTIAEADALNQSVRAALREDFLTPDLGGTQKTVAVGDWLAKFVSQAVAKSTRRQ